MKIKNWQEMTLLYWVKYDGEDWKREIKVIYQIQEMPWYCLFARFKWIPLKYRMQLEQKIVTKYIYPEFEDDHIIVPPKKPEGYYLKYKGDMFVTGTNLERKNE